MTRPSRRELERAIEALDTDDHRPQQTRAESGETRKAVREALADLPADATDKERRVAVQDALAERYGLKP